MHRTTFDNARTTRSIRRGVTLIDVIVSTAALGLLMAILLPAIANSRHSAAKALCRSRMSQVGRATHNFEGRNRRYPDGIGSLSWHYELLPDLEQSALYRQLKVFEDPDTPVVLEITRSTALPVFQCPTDPRLSTSPFAFNWVMNKGSMFYIYEELDSHAFNMSPLSARDVTDGLSMTAFVSEKMNVFLAQSSDRRGVWRTPILYGYPNQLDLFADLCESMPSGAAGGPYDYCCNEFSYGSQYNHIVRPNRSTCLNGTAQGGGLAAWTANSLHLGGVNVLLADGAVRFVSDSVGRPVWRAMGTRNGHEAFTLP